MITQLKIKFRADENIKPESSLSALFHGALLEKLNSAFVQDMHVSELHPYTQYISGENGSIVWNIQTFSDYAKENIVDFLLDASFSSIEINRLKKSFAVAEKSISETSFDELMDLHFYESSKRFVSLDFISQTAFKQNGKYIFIPDTRLIFNSLVRKFEAFSSIEIADSSFADFIENDITISEYNLRSRSFFVGKNAIPSFCGNIGFRLCGESDSVSLADMLLDFAQLSGVGIKCSMGMGACKIKKSADMGRP